MLLATRANTAFRLGAAASCRAIRARQPFAPFGSGASAATDEVDSDSVDTAHDIAKRVAFVGAGKMGEAMIGGLTRRYPAQKVVVYDPHTERTDFIKDTYKVDVAPTNVAAVSDAELVIFAVKPQNAEKVFADLKGAMRPDALVLSILAGVPLAQFVNGLGVPAVVRSMPNTPAMVGEGMTMWVQTPAVTPKQHEQAKKLLRCFGHEIFAEDEHYLDMATALSGTGPAYFFYILEALIDAGVHMGLPRQTATKLTTQTCLGSIKYFMHSNQHPVQMRNDITSPGGTTASALYTAERGGLRTVLSDSVWSAYRRSLELGNHDSRVGPGRSKFPPQMHDK